MKFFETRMDRFLGLLLAFASIEVLHVQAAIGMDDPIDGSCPCEQPGEVLCQKAVSSVSDAEKAIIAIDNGVAPADAINERCEPIRHAASYAEILYRNLFNAEPASAIPELWLNAPDPALFDIAVGDLIEGTSPDGAFFINVTRVVPSTLDGLAQADIDALNTAGVGRVWSVVGDYLTGFHGELAISVVIEQTIGSETRIFAIPVLSPSDPEFLDDIIAAGGDADGLIDALTGEVDTSGLSNHGDGDGGVGDIDNGLPGLSDAARQCLRDCRDARTDAIEDANFVFDAAVVAASAIYLAALAACTVIAFIPLIGVGTGTICALSATATYAGAVFAALGVLAIRKAYIKAEYNRCIQDCADDHGFQFCDYFLC